MATYLVTGGAGFIGSHLCDALLKKNHIVYVLDNLSTGKLANLDKRVKFIDGDILDLPLLSSIMSNIDGCFHLAAMASVSFCNEYLLDAHHVNATGTINIIECARNMLNKHAKIIPIIFASSSAVYGDNQDMPHKEVAQTIPISSYGAQKLLGEYYGRYANELFGIPFTILRLFNVYGPRQTLASNYSGVITLFLNNLIDNTPLTIYGDGHQSRDFIYVGDVADFFIKAMEAPTKIVSTYNVCSGHSISVKRIAELLSAILDKNTEIFYQPAKIGEVYYSSGSPDHAKINLGIQTKISLETGLTMLTQSFLEKNR